MTYNVFDGTLNLAQSNPKITRNILDMKTYRPEVHCSNKTIGVYRIFKLSTSGHNSCSQPRSPPINRLINDRLLDT